MRSFINNSIFRWIAVLPGAVLAAFAAMFPWHWLVVFLANTEFWELGQGSGVGTLVRILEPENVERLGYGFIVPSVMIIIAAKIAPRHKLATGRVVALLVVTVLIWVAFISEASFIDYFQYASGWDTLYPIVLVGLWCSGIYAALRFNKGQFTD